MGMRELFGMMKMFHVLAGVRIMWARTFARSDQLVYLRSVPFRIVSYI